MGEKYSGRKFKTVFKGKDLPEDTRTAEITRFGKNFNDMSLMTAKDGGFAGNMSFRNNRGFVITAGGVSKGILTPKNFVQVLTCNMDVKKVWAEGELEPSSETFMHYIIYRERPDVNAVIHVHDDLVLENAKKLGIAVTGKEEPYGTPELAYEVQKVLNHENYIAIKKHGVISLGKSLWEAGNIIITMHREAESKAEKAGKG